MKRKYLSLLFGILFTLSLAASSFAATTYQYIQFRRGLSALWTSTNPVLAQGEPGYETDTGKLKMGDGLTHWVSLAYYPPTFTNDWIVQSGSLTYYSATQFYVSGDQTSVFLATVRVRAVVTAGTIYGTVTTATAAGTPLKTTVTVVWDSGALDAGLSEVAVNILSFVNISVLPSLMPAGVIMPYAGTAAPSGWMLCYGQAISRATYSTLYAVIGTNFGSGDGMTTFNLPDLRGRMAIGLDNMGGSAAGRVAAATSLAVSGGLETMNLAHTHLTGDHTLTVAEMPSHTHPLALAAAAGGDRSYSNTGITTQNTDTGSTGGDTPHNHGPTASSLSATTASMNPYLATSYIIKY